MVNESSPLPGEAAMADVSQELGELRAMAMNMKPGNWAWQRRPGLLSRELTGAVGNLVRDSREWPQEDAQLFTSVHALGPEAERRVVNAAGKIALVWHFACVQNKQERPFRDPDMPKDHFEPADLKRKDVAILATLPIEITGYLSATLSSSVKSIPIKYHSLDWIQRWLSGEIVSQWAEAEELDPTEVAMFATPNLLSNILKDSSRTPLKKFISMYSGFHSLTLASVTSSHELDPELTETVLTASTRRRIATSFSDPMSKAGEIANAYRDILSPENLAGKLKISVREARHIFSHSVRLQIATNYTVEPIEGAANYYDVLTNRLSSENIADVLELDEKLVNKLFPLYIRREFAQKNIKDIHDPLIRYKRVVGQLSGMGLPMSVAMTVAVKRTRRPIEFATKLLASLKDKPAKISDEIWLCATARHPLDPDKRDEFIKLFYVFMSIKRALSLDTGFFGESYHERVGSTETDPAEILFESDDPDDEIRSLAAEAGISDEQLERLLSHFNGPDDASRLSAEDAEILRSLQKAGGQHNELD